MTNHSDTFPGDALEHVAYLARSDNRVQILKTLSSESYNRRDLVDETGVSSATVGRVLTELQTRGWAERTQDGYVATPAGTQVTAEFEPFIGAMETIQHLGDAVEWIPTDELDIGLHHFSDVTVRRPERYDPADITDFFVDMLQDVSSFRTLTHLVPIEAKERIMLEGVRSGRLTIDIVMTAGLLDYLQEHPGHRARWKKLLEAGATANSFDAHIPCNLFILGDLVLLADSHSNSGHPYACIVSENPTIRSWAHDLIDRYRMKAEPIDVDTISEERSVPTENRSVGDRPSID